MFAPQPRLTSPPPPSSQLARGSENKCSAQALSPTPGVSSSDSEANKSSRNAARIARSIALHVPRSGASVGTAIGGRFRRSEPPRSVKASKPPKTTSVLNPRTWIRPKLDRMRPSAPPPIPFRPPRLTLTGARMVSHTGRSNVRRGGRDATFFDEITCYVRGLISSDE